MASPNPISTYLTDLHQSLGVGVPETSGYPALRNLLNAVGETLKPKIVAVLHPSNTGAGLPDGGLFAAKDLKKFGDDAPAFQALKPERGVIEVKGLAQDLAGIEQTPQLRNYLEHYDQVLVTNYRTFALFSWKNGKPIAGERYAIADSESVFWELAHTMRADPTHPGHERLWQFLRRALLSTARIATPQDLARFLASYAKEARARVQVAPMGTLEPVKKALSDALGVHFEGDRGIHFFQSTLIQTLFYGVFSAWVLWHESHPKAGDRFHWRLSAEHLGLPILRTLFVQLAGDPKKVRALQLEEVLDWTEECLARVDRTGFFARYDMGDAVQYFYEPFLAEFDPELRKDFGVWYTPPEIVRYMVASVDSALRDNFGVADGLADPTVVVLDPCCGTGAFLVESLRLIRRRMVDSYGEAQAGLKIREVAKKRLFGFELLPAPYVVSHLQIDLMLTRWGAALNHEKDERAGVFLTNALTGWVPVAKPKDLPFAEFGDERDAADHVKQREHILVILGNPPYDGYAAMAVDEERSLSEAYRTTKAAPAPQGQGLNDLYIRFFRMAERRIAEGVPQFDDSRMGEAAPHARGIVCFISNYSWLDGLSHTGMRERFLEVFDRISIDCLNGDKYKTGKRTPKGLPDPSVFSTEKNREGIQVGTAIALLERRPKAAVDVAPGENDLPRAPLGGPVRFRHWWGNQKRAELLRALTEPQEWQQLRPAVKLGLPFSPIGVRDDYSEWPSLVTLIPKSYPGVKTSRDDALVCIDRGELESRLVAYFDPSIRTSDLTGKLAGLARSTATFNAEEVRDGLIKQGMGSGVICPYVYRPFDLRWLYWQPVTKLLDRSRPEFFSQVVAGNLFIEARQHQTQDGFSRGLVTSYLADNFGNGLSSFFPLHIHPMVSEGAGHPDLFTKSSGTQPNLTPEALNYVSGLGCVPEDLFFHIIAILHAPAYRDENSGALRQDWPRLPLPKNAGILREGVTLGRKLTALFDPEASIAGVTGLGVMPELRGLGELSATLQPKQGGPDLAIAARWGYLGQGNVVMPGPGRVEAGTRGEGFLDVYLNDTMRWKDVPVAVWNYSLSGYQVLKKWLSYREQALLGRPLTSDEAQTFTTIVRRIATILSLQHELDEHYRKSI